VSEGPNQDILALKDDMNVRKLIAVIIL